MASSADIERAIADIDDQPSFLRFLSDTLEWPIGGEPQTIEDISYGWTQQELRAADLDKKILAGQVLQIANLHPDQPWGIFVLEFKSVDPFLAERGMTGVLRKVLRGLVPSRRKDPSQRSWQRPNLLFVCTHKYEHFRFAYFKAPSDGNKTAPLAAFGWGPDIPARTACEFNLPALGWPDDPTDAAAWVSAWAEAFNVEKVTKRFYTDYAAQFEKLRAAVNPLTGEDQKMFTQALMNRLMFLRFIERKGWLTPPGGERSKDYLRLLFQAGGYRGKSFYAGRLRKLFFEALAVEGKQESEAVGKVVFLNGGLFEESDLDKKVDDIPDAAFVPLLGPDGLLYRYNFTVQESTPLDIEVAVDPEMLGKVFEELVTGRHESGSYYTPRPVVSFMCREALKGYLTDATGIDAEKTAAFVDRHEVKGITIDAAKKIAGALDDVRAVDPACGSGAYLLGLLHEIVDLYRLLYSDKLKTDARELHRIKLNIIEKCLYGVDKDEFATNIAMLRLWLSLTVDSDTPQALPNLDFKIEVGDSLTGPDPREMPDLMRVNLDEKARQLAILKGKYMRARSEEKRSLRRLVVKEQREIAFELCSLSPGSIDWRVQFCEIFFSNRTGFDIVLANPPYISGNTLNKTSPDLVRSLRTAYETAQGRGFDLFGCFLERAVHMLRPNGMLVYIIPSGWYTGSGFSSLRRFIATRTDTRLMVNLPYDVFAAAWVDTTIFAASPRKQATRWPRQAPCLARVRNFEKREQIIGIADFYRNVTIVDVASWFAEGSDLYLTRSDAVVVPLLKKIESTSRPLGDLADVQRGVTPFKLTDKREGRDFKPAFAGTVRRYLLDRGPARFIKFDETLAEPKPERYFQGPRLLLRELISRQFQLQATYADEDFVTNKSMQSVLPLAGGPRLKFLLGCINSAVCSWVFLQRSNVAHRDDFPKIVLKETRLLPIPTATDEQQMIVERLTDELIAAKAQAGGGSFAELDRRLDDFVSDLFGLSEADRRVIFEPPT